MQCPPTINTPPDVDLRSLQFPPQSLSVNTKAFSISSCQSYLHMTLFLPTKYLATFFSFLHDPFFGVDISRLQVLEGNCRSGQSRLRKFCLAANPRNTLASLLISSSSSPSTSLTSLSPLTANALEPSSNPKYLMISSRCLGSASYSIPSSVHRTLLPRMTTSLSS